MYGKIFTQMYDGSLYGRWQALVTFQQLIVLADKDGIVDMTIGAIAARTSIPIEIIEQGIRELEEPDWASRTPDEAGRRIVRLSDHRDWGWEITNYKYYRAIRTAEERREYFKEHKRQSRAAAKMVSNVSRELAESTTVHHVSTDSTNSSKQYAEAEVNNEEDDERGKVVRDIETALIGQYGPEWEPVAALLESRAPHTRSRWVKEVATLTMTYGPATVARACNDALAAPQPLKMPSGLRAGCAGLRQFGVREAAIPAGRGGSTADKRRVTNEAAMDAWLAKKEAGNG